MPLHYLSLHIFRLFCWIHSLGEWAYGKYCKVDPRPLCRHETFPTMLPSALLPILVPLTAGDVGSAPQSLLLTGFLFRKHWKIIMERPITMGIVLFFLCFSEREWERKVGGNRIRTAIFLSSLSSVVRADEERFMTVFFIYVCWRVQVTLVPAEQKKNCE